MRLPFCQLKLPQYLYTGAYLAPNRPVLQFHHTIRTITTTGPAADQAETETPLTERLKRRIWGVNLPDALKPKAKTHTTPPEKKALHEDPTSADSYVPCHDGRDLRVVGFVGKLGVKKAGPKQIESFPLQDRVTDPGVLKALLRRAVLETYTIILHGRDATAGISKGTIRTVDFTRDVDVVYSPDGGFQFLYKSNGVLAEILGQSPEMIVGGTAETVQADQGTEKTQRAGGVQGVGEGQEIAGGHGVVKPGATKVHETEIGQGTLKAHEAVKVQESAKAHEAVKAQEPEKVQWAGEVQEAGEGQGTAKVRGIPGAEKTQGGAKKVLVQEPTKTQGTQIHTKIAETAQKVREAQEAQVAGGVRTEKAQSAVEVQKVHEAVQGSQHAIKVHGADKTDAEDTQGSLAGTNKVQSTAEIIEPPVCPQSLGSQTILPVQTTSNTPAEAWLSLPLPPMHLFAIHKRILATTGQRLSDNALSGSPTVSDLLRELLAVAAPPPDKLDLLQVAPELAQLDNVKVLRTRIRPVDKNIRIGMLSPGVKEWLEVKRKKAAGEEVDGQFVYKWDEGKYFVA